MPASGQNKKQLRQKIWQVRGTSTVEMAIVAPLFFLLIFALFEYCLLFFVNLSMQYAVREGARYAVTGQSNLDPNTANPQRYLAVIEKIKDSSMGVYAYVNPVITINNTQYQSSGSYTSNMFGNPGDVVVLQLNCSWPIVTPLMKPFFTGGIYNFSVAATMRNEAFL